MKINSHLVLFFILFTVVVISIPIYSAESAIPTFDAILPMYDHIIQTSYKSLQIGLSIEAHADKPIINEETRFLIGFLDIPSKTFYNNVVWSAFVTKEGKEIKSIKNETSVDGKSWMSITFKEPGDYQIQIIVEKLVSDPDFSEKIIHNFKVYRFPEEQVCDSGTVLVGGECVIEDKESFAQDCEPIELQYNVEHGKMESTCYDKKTVSLLLEVTVKYPSKITVHIPKTKIFSVDQECNSGDITVLLNGEEIEPSRLKMSETNSERISTIILPEGFNNIEFIGTPVLGSPSPLDICGEIHGYHTQYIPPTKQLKFGVDPTEIRCNKGMELVFKQIGNYPVCIKHDTVNILVKRGWTQNQTITPNPSR